jgi:hypothetical protein
VAELETVDIPAVEILASGGPVHAIGSPPEGDFYTRDELVAMADAHRELGNEIRAPIKLGHSEVQQLAANSGLTAGEMPALGWLDSASFRVEDDEETGVAKLLADAKAVPKKVAELMRAGAYRTRSSEIRKYASQATQKSYDWVVDGLALLGANVPAIQTLDDVYRLYERAGIDKPDADTFVIRRLHAAGDVVWNVEDGLEDLRGDLNDALNPYAYDMPGVPRLWVRDVARSSDVALVSSGWGDDDDAWVVPFTVNDDGTVTPAPRAEWKAAEQTWVAATNELERRYFATWTTAYINNLPDSAFLYVESGEKDADGKTTPRSKRHFPYKDDTGKVDLPHLRNALARIPQSSLPDDVKKRLTTKAQGILDKATRKNAGPAESRAMQLELTDEQEAAVREKFGLEADAEITPEQLIATVDERANELETLKTKIEELEQRKNEASELDKTVRKLEADLKIEQTKRFEMERDADLHAAAQDGRIDPADLEEWRKDYERDQEGTRRILARLKPDETLAREFGREDGDLEDADDEAYRRDFELRHGQKASV